MHVDGIVKYIFRSFMGICRTGGSLGEKLNSLILEDTEVSGTFQTLTAGKYVKWVTLQMHGIRWPVCSVARGKE